MHTIVSFDLAIDSRPPCNTAVLRPAVERYRRSFAYGGKISYCNNPDYSPVLDRVDSGTEAKSTLSLHTPAVDQDTESVDNVFSAASCSCVVYATVPHRRAKESLSNAPRITIAATMYKPTSYIQDLCEIECLEAQLE